MASTKLEQGFASSIPNKHRQDPFLLMVIIVGMLRCYRCVLYTYLPREASLYTPATQQHKSGIFVCHLSHQARMLAYCTWYIALDTREISGGDVGSALYNRRWCVADFGPAQIVLWYGHHVKEHWPCVRVVKANSQGQAGQAGWQVQAAQKVGSPFFGLSSRLAWGK